MKRLTVSVAVLVVAVLPVWGQNQSAAASSSPSVRTAKTFAEGRRGDDRTVSNSAALSRIFARVLPGYTFKRSKMKGCRVDRASPDGFWTCRAEDSKTNEVAWADFYKRHPANFCEAINLFASNDMTNVLGGCRNRMSFLRLAACVIEESCPDVSGAKEYCAKLRSQADELTQALRASTWAESAKPTPESRAKKLAEGSAAVQAGEAKNIATKKSHPRRTVNLDRASSDVVIRILQLKSPRFVCNGFLSYSPVSFRSAPGVRLSDSQVVSMACEALRMNGVSFTEDGDKVHIGRGVPTTSTPMWATSAQLKEEFVRAFKSTNENVPVDASWNFQSALPSDVAGFLADTMKMALIFCPGLSQERISCACDGMTAYDAASKLYDELIAKKVALFEFEAGIWKAAPKKDAYETFSSEGKTYVRIVAGAEKYVGDIVIPSSIGDDPVVSIGSGAFEDCSLLTSIRIPSGVTNIELSAFRGCKKLKSVTIPPSVTSIGGGAFENCISLESLTIPSSVKNLGYLMLEGCSGLRTLTISSLKGEPRSRHGALRSVTIPDGVTSIESEAFRDFGGIETVTIPNGVEDIGALAFYYCSGLKSVTIPTSVTNIGHEAFAACSRLESVTIPSSVTSLGENAFSRCPKLTTVCVVRDGKEEHLTISEFKEQWKSRMVDRTSTESRRQAIVCGKEKNVRIWKDPQTEITWCYSVCNDDTASLKPSLCFSKGMPTLSGDVVIPEILDGHVVTDIVWWDIGDCVDLTSLRIPKTVRQLRMNSASVFTLTNLTIEAGCGCSRSIGRFVLEGTWLQAVCAGGTSRLAIPEEVEGLVEGCFAGASWLEEVRIPSTVKKVAAGAFAGCKGLYRRYDPDGRGYMVFDGWLIPDGNIKCRELEVPLGVRHIASTEYPERCWKNVTSVKFPEGLVSIGEGAFVGSNIETIEFPGSLKRCDGFGKAPLVFGRRVVSDRPLRNVIFNSGDASFCMPDSVRRVTFAEGVTDIGVLPEGRSRSGLSGGAGVTTVVLPAGLRSICTLPDFPELTEITIPSSVTNIGKTVFQSCKKLRTVGVEKNGSVELVPIDEFRRLWNLFFPGGSIHLTDAKTGIRWLCGHGGGLRPRSDSVRIVGMEGGGAPTSLAIPESLEGLTVEGVVWDKMVLPSVVELRIPRGMTCFDRGAVERALPNLQSIVVEDGNKSFSSSDGVLCDAKTVSVWYCPRTRKGRVSLADGIKIVADGAFSGCTNVTEIVMPSSVKTIDANAFSGCSRLEKLHLPEGLCSIGDGAFDGCVKLLEKAKRYDGFYVLDGWVVDPWGVGIQEHGVLGRELVLPDGVRGVAERTFAKSKVRDFATNEVWTVKPMLSASFPKSLRHIDDGAFSGAEIERLVLPDGIRSIGATAFSDCTNLLSVSIPSTIEKWGVDVSWRSGGGAVFRGCTSLKEVRIVEGLRELPTAGFDGCCSLESVAIPSSVTNGLENAFSECPSLQSLVVSSENPIYQSFDGVVYTKDGKKIIFCPRGKQTVDIPNGVTSIGYGAFYSCANLTSLVIPSSIKVIGPNAFSCCNSITNITIPEGVECIGYSTFGNCRRLVEIRMPSTVREIGLLAGEGECVPERILTAPGDADRIYEIMDTHRSPLIKTSGQKDRRFEVDGNAVVRKTSRVERNGDCVETVSWQRWRDPETGIAWLYSVQGDDAVDVRTEFLKGYKGHLEVPAQLGGKQVSGLLGLYGGGDVTSLSLPMSVTNVNAKVLESCTKLKSVKMNVDGELKTIEMEDLRKQWNLSGSKNPAVSPAKGNLRQGGLLRARRLQRRQQEAAAKAQTDQAKAQREAAEQAEQRAQILAIQEELRRVREAKAAAKEKQKGK